MNLTTISPKEKPPQSVGPRTSLVSRLSGGPLEVAAMLRNSSSIPNTNNPTTLLQTTNGMSCAAPLFYWRYA